MKQNIRYQTFETNSSSYHTLAIYNKKELNSAKEIIKGQDIEISPIINIHTIGGGGSYSYIAKSSYEKAQCLIKFLAWNIADQIDQLNDSIYSEEELFYRTFLVKCYVKAIKRYIGEDNEVTIKFTHKYNPFIDGVSDESMNLYELLGVNEEDLNNEIILTNRFYDIIFNPDVEISDECEYNE